MKRKFLEDLGLEKDVIDQIMSEHGAGITAAKADVQTIEAERDDLKSKYETAEQTINRSHDCTVAERFGHDEEGVRPKAAINRIRGKRPGLHHF
jgi:hypothetical protein